MICVIAFWLIGYGVAFGGGNPYIGTNYFALVDIPKRKLSEWFFQYTFASTASTILSGAVAERASFVSYLSYSFLMSGLYHAKIEKYLCSIFLFVNDGQIYMRPIQILFTVI